jgi:predicted phosphate transport protein (TIGR00153 family)
MRLRLIPRDEKFFELFVIDAENVLTAARVLQYMFQNFGERERLASQLIDLEHRGDELSHDIGRRLEGTFVTPIDREEIHALISRLDDVIDLIEEVADTCVLYGITDPTPAAIEQAEIVVRQCEQIEQAMRNLGDFKTLERYWIEIHRLENAGDRIVRRAIASLFADGQDPIELIKWKDVYTLLEETIDACEDVANVIERIFVKHA